MANCLNMPFRLMDWDTPPRIDEPELIDDENQPYADFRVSMSDVRNANRFLGGTVVVTRQMKRWFQNPALHALNRSLTILDVATGSADIPEALLPLAVRARIPIKIIGLDFSPPILRFAHEKIGDHSKIRLLRGDAFRLPFADNSIDIVLCSLAFHHWGMEQSIVALREMERVARFGWVVNDLRRAWSAWYLIRLVANLTRMNRLTRHDGPASVLRAYSIPEYRQMAEALNLQVGQDVELKRSLFYRVALIREKQ
jgi:ubiquinone/menaquinone biosynthesis C-methylase UbiE